MAGKPGNRKYADLYVVISEYRVQWYTPGRVKSGYFSGRGTTVQ